MSFKIAKRKLEEEPIEPEGKRTRTTEDSDEPDNATAEASNAGDDETQQQQALGQYPVIDFSALVMEQIMTIFRDARATARAEGVGEERREVRAIIRICTTLDINDIVHPDGLIDLLFGYRVLSKTEVIIGLALLDRLCLAHPPVFTPESLQILWVVVLIIASKINMDRHYDNASFSLVSRIPLEGINEAERHVLELLELNLLVTAEEYHGYSRRVTNPS